MKKDLASGRRREKEGKSSLPSAPAQGSFSADQPANITELEVELRLAREALDRSRADMQAFAYSVSHDLRAPLRAIQGFSKILVEDFSSNLEGDAQTFLRHIIQSTQLLSDQIEDLLRFSRAGKSSPAKIQVNTSQLLAEILQNLDLPRNFQVTIGELPPVFADPILLRQVFSELIENAAKFSATRAEPELRIAARQDHHSVTLSFKDNGVGFASVQSAKLFQVFQKLHHPSEYSGNGVGLAIVKRIIEAHGGCVEAEGSAGSGADFRVTLPLSREQRPLICDPDNNARQSTWEVSA